MASPQLFSAGVGTRDFGLRFEPRYERRLRIL